MTTFKALKWHCSPLLPGLILTAMASNLFAQTRPAYETEIWPPARQLVWATPGKGGDFTKTENWVNADGTPATAIPDRTTDVRLPVADKPYDVKGSRLNAVRHVTIEANAGMQGSHRNELEIWGNCWVKPDGLVMYVSVRGDKHTFFRIDETEYPNQQNQLQVDRSVGLSRDRRSRGYIGHKFQVLKIGSASVEFLGKFGVSDEAMLQRGKMIVSDEFRFSGETGKGAFEIFDGAILELQSGARVAPFIGPNRKAVFNINIYRNGAIQAGSPERPLTRDAYLMLGFAENDIPGRTGLYGALGSMIRVYTADPENARLVITSITSDPDFCNGKGAPIDGDPDENASGNNGIMLQLAGDIDLNHVTVDYVCEDGIGLVNPAQRSEWPGLKIGSHCAGPAETLMTELQIEANTYYHARGDMESEYGLTTRAVAEMQAFLEQSDPFRITTHPPTSTMRQVRQQEQNGTVRKQADEPVNVKAPLHMPQLVITAQGVTSILEPVEDASLSDSNPPLFADDERLVNNHRLYVEHTGSRSHASYLKFDLKEVSVDALTSMALHMTSNDSPGSPATLQVCLGDHSDWSETSEVANALSSSTKPAAVTSLATLKTTRGSAACLDLKLPLDIRALRQAIDNRRLWTLILTAEPAGKGRASDFTFLSKDVGTIVTREGTKRIAEPRRGALQSPVAIVYTKPVDVTIETRVPGAKLRYSLDGAEPTKDSPVYVGPIRLDKTTRLSVKAYKLGVGFSPTFTTTYVIEQQQGLAVHE